MDYILQKDADSRAARKRKRATAKATIANKTAAAAAAGDSAAAGTVDPQAAAAALHAFGAVVDLCTQPGCRRVKLLRHFGEEYKPQQQQRASAEAAVRCCDYCDSPSSVEAAQQQLKDAEVALLQRWRGRGLHGAWQQGGGKRQRFGEALFDGAGSGSGDDDASGEGELAVPRVGGSSWLQGCGAPALVRLG
jgi:hypothetical protein